MKKYLQVSEVAEQLGCSASLVYREISCGRLPHVRLTGKRVVIEQAELDRFLALRRVTAEEAADKALRDRDVYR